MRLGTSLFGQQYLFKSVKEVMAKANEEKSGDALAGIIAETMTERVAAKEVLSQLTLETLYHHPSVPYDEDEVTRLIYDDLSMPIYEEIKEWTVADLREWILDEDTTNDMIRRVSRGLTSEMIAAVTKLMSNMDLVLGAQKMIVTAHCNTTIGEPGTLSFRLQPNHTTDNLDGIMVSLMEGVSYGVGDAVLGLNPVIDTVESVGNILKMFDEFKRKWEIPTQTCVLAHVTTQMGAIEKGAPADLMFQSIAGSQKGNEAFGFTVDTLRQAESLMKKHSTATGPNYFYFETGQGSELSSEAHHDTDQVTMESRCYGLARHFKPFLVNTVVGFIGPEYLYDSKQVTRAGLEDHFMGKLHGLPMGVDACYTNHMKTDQNDIENLAVLLTMAGCNYFMAIPAGDDIMLNYQCTGYHDAHSLRSISGKKPIKAFGEWLERMEIVKDGKLTKRAGDASIFMK
ncbi:ethanolamine ammonia-lyase subunit EutB [Tindallia californiensis]|uniref:Ethanolamine ammonia-lyase large subunit n=1 Tax=Tindallia californiensis TaxID=159292 RepID=A0A1H3LSP1_9FIRM|nr:ethanolamine ammonia-lyase subunit EutB [Tindallia californiensis]SDY67411.1 Ethanolamine ammonia-lyase heavy chain [Tindallia californiensis]